MLTLWPRIRSALLHAFEHDVANTAKAAAFSGMLMLFPALLVVTTLVAQVQEGSNLLGGLRTLFEQFFPPDTLDMLQSYVLTRPLQSTQLLFSAAILTLLAGLGMMLSLMEGFRRAYRLPVEAWSFWDKRLRALLLVPIALVPLSVATLGVIFGHEIELWMIRNSGHEWRFIVIFLWRLLRWSIAMLTSVAVMTVLYHFGTRRKEGWLWVAPGAIAGTVIWFPATLAFGLSFLAYGAVVIPFLLVLFLSGIALGVCATGVVLRFGPAAEWFVWPIPALISPFAGVFYPLSTLPWWMRVVSRVLPPAYVFENLRAILAGRAVSVPALFGSASLAVVEVLLAGWFFARIYRHGVRTGVIARYSAETLG